MMAKLRNHTIQQWFADFIDALQDSQLEKGPLGPILADAPPVWPLRSVNHAARYH
jgi:trehalose 6-phosphate synthase